ncbi:MAG: hypothetical protein ABI779_01445 [Acidobacteriota bacterium]
MKTITRTLKTAALLLAVAVLGCSSELSNSGAPVELVVTNTQNLQILDVGPTTDPDCDGTIGTIDMLLLAKRENVSTPFTQARITRYRVSYQRTDGGRLVPAPFVRSTDTLISVGGTASLGQFLVIEPDAFSQAPFAALLPQNGGRDPDTGRAFVKLDVIVEVFGETIGGDRVYDATRFPLEFCYGCGCS